MMDRISMIARNRRVSAIAILVMLAMVVAVLVVLRGGSKSEAERAEEALNEGLEAQVAGDLETAEAAYLRVLQLDPQNKFAYYNLGLISAEQGDPVGAESSYRTSIQIDPDFVPALFNLAILRAGSGAGEEAVDLYEHIIEAQPDYAAAHLNLGFLLIDLGEEARGQAELDEAVRLDPTLTERIDTGETQEGATGATGTA